MDHVERVISESLMIKRLYLETVWKNGKSEKTEKYTLTRLDPEHHAGSSTAAAVDTSLNRGINWKRA